MTPTARLEVISYPLRMTHHYTNLTLTYALFTLFPMQKLTNFTSGFVLTGYLLTQRKLNIYSSYIYINLVFVYTNKWNSVEWHR